MSSLPLAAKVLLAALLAGSILAAFFGPPPARRRPGAFAVLAVAGLGLYAGAGVAVWAAESVRTGALLVMAAVEVMCLAGWLVRGRDDRRPPPDEDADPDAPDPSADDATGFEAALRRWQRERPRSLTG